MIPALLRVWLPIAIAATFLAGTADVIGQQILRQGANDPQVQIAEDAAARVQAGTPPADVVPAGQTEISTSLAPWVIVYGPDRKVVASSATLHGKSADYPTSVLDNAPPGGRDAITWQPEPGVRAATVVIGFKGGWVVAGRSLRLVEQRVDLLLQLALVGWLLALGGSAVAVVAAELLARRLEPR
jgi:hypothetical protein